MTTRKTVNTILSVLTVGLVVFFCLGSKLNILTPLLSLYILLPLLAFAVIWHYRDLKAAPVCLTDMVLLAIFLYEVINPFFVPREGTAAFWSIFHIVALLLYFLLRWGLDKKYLPLLYHSFTLLALAAACTGIKSFADFIRNISEAGFTTHEVIPLRFLYAPWKIMQNDWATLLLWLLPFPLLSAHSLKEKYRIFPVSVFFLCGYAMVLTLSRGIFLAVAVFLILAVVSLKGSKCPFAWNKKKYYLLTVLFLLALIPVRKPILNVVRVNASIVQQQSTTGRLGLWNRCIDIAREHPAFGIGSRSFVYENMKLCYRNRLTVTRKTTNIYLQVLTEKGFIGAALYLVLLGNIGYLLWRGFRKKQAGDAMVQCITLSLLVAMALREGTFSTLFDIDSAFILFCVWLFILQGNTVPKTTRYPAGILAVCTLALLAGGYTVAYRHYFRSKFTMHMNQNAVFYSQQGDPKGTADFLGLLPEYQNISPVVTFNRALAEIAPEDTLSFDAVLREHTLPDFSSAHTAALILKMERAYNEAPEFPLLSQNMGWLYLLNGRPEDACDVWEQGLLYKPDATTLLLSLGMVDELQQDRENAARLYAEALAYAPYTVESPFFADLTRRDKDLATGALERAITKLDTPQATLKEHVQLAKLLYTTGKDNERAQLLLEEAVKTVPNLNRAWLTLGDLYYRQGQLAKAESCFKKSFLLDNTDYLASLRLYRVYRQKNNSTLQEQYRKRALLIYRQRMAQVENLNGVLFYEYLPDVQYPMNVNTYLYPSIVF